MDNIIEYIRTYGQNTFAQKPFNEVDSLVICQLSYMNFQPFVPSLKEKKEAVSVQSILEQDRMEELLAGYWYKEQNEELIRAAAASKRFGNMELNYHENVVEEETDTQFSALTCFPDEGICYVAYRGTDATIVGWKEDLNLALSEPTHSQELAVEYLNKVYSRVKQDLFVGDYASVKNRMFKFIPKSSIVGVIMETCENCEIIESRSIGAMQHNSFNWRIDGDHFVRVEDRTTAQKLQDEALNEWILSLSQEQVRTFVDTLYEVVTASGAEDVFEFGGDLKGCITRSYEAMRDLDENTRRAVHTILHALYEIAGEKFREEFNLRWEELQREFQKSMEKSKKRWSEDAKTLKNAAQKKIQQNRKEKQVKTVDNKGKNM